MVCFRLADSHLDKWNVATTSVKSHKDHTIMQNYGNSFGNRKNTY